MKYITCRAVEGTNANKNGKNYHFTMHNSDFVMFASSLNLDK